MFKNKFWRNKKEKGDLKQTVDLFSIRCSNYGKEIMIDVDFWNTTYQEIITTFVLNTMLHHFRMIWIIEKRKELKYYMDI